MSLPLAISRICHGNVRGHAAALKGLFAGALIIAGVLALAQGRLLGNGLWKGVSGYP